MSKNLNSYTAVATAVGGRNGNVKTSDGLFNLQISTPKEFGGLTDGYTNPEQLFAMGWAACFDNAIIMVAKGRRVEITLGSLEGGGIGLSAVIKVKIDGVNKDVAQKIVDAAHNVCPYSKITKGNIDAKIMLDTDIQYS